VGAVVLSLTVVLPVPVILAGLKEHVVNVGRPVHEVELKFTVLL